MISVDHYFRLHQTPKNTKIFYVQTNGALIQITSGMSASNHSFHEIFVKKIFNVFGVILAWFFFSFFKGSL
jgi:hypothetical protein